MSTLSREREFKFKNSTLIVWYDREHSKQFNPFSVSKQCKGLTWNLSNVLHQQNTQFFRFYQRNTHKSRHFGKNLENNFKQFFNFFSRALLVMLKTNSTSVQAFAILLAILSESE